LWLDKALDGGILEVDADRFENSAWFGSPGMQIEIKAGETTKLFHDAVGVKNTYKLDFLSPVRIPWRSASAVKVVFTVNQQCAEQDIDPFARELLRSGYVDFTLPSKDDDDYRLVLHVKLYDFAAKFPAPP